MVGVASSGDEALRLAQTQRPYVALVDVDLGDEEEMKLNRRMTSASATQVLLVGASADLPAGQEQRQPGAGLLYVS